MTRGEFVPQRLFCVISNTTGILVYEAKQNTHGSRYVVLRYFNSNFALKTVGDDVPILVGKVTHIQDPCLTCKGEVQKSQGLYVFGLRTVYFCSEFYYDFDICRDDLWGPSEANAFTCPIGSLTCHCLQRPCTSNIREGDTTHVE